MRIAFIAAGAGGMYCGSCLRDNTLVREVNTLGHDMTLLPVYTPLRVDEESAGGTRVFLGAVDIYLQEKFASMRRRPGFLGRLLGSQTVLRWLSRFSLDSSPEEMGRLTISMLDGEDGNQRRSIEELTCWLAQHPRPEVVHLTNALLCGLAVPLRRALGVPIVCGLQGEDLFLDGLPADFRGEALRRIRERTADVERFVAASRYYAERSAALFGIDPGRIDAVVSGIRTGDFTVLPPLPEDGRRPTIGYLARIAPEKGLHVLVDAFERLAVAFPDLRLRVGGYLGGRNIAYAAAVRRRLAASGLSDRVEILGTLDRSQKLAFLRTLDVLSVPTVYAEPKGIFIMEALASGVPVVQPRHGVFPELVEGTGGGLLHDPQDAADLASKLAILIENPDLRRSLAEKGRAAVLDRFSARRMADDTIEVYRKVLGGRAATEAR